MKLLLFAIIITASANTVLAQSKCPFGGEGTHRNDQYSKSSASDIKASQNAMDKQIATFQTKKRYQSDFKVAGRKKKNTKPMM